MRKFLWWIRGHFVWHHRDYWYGRYAWTGVNSDDMPNRYISEWEFWVKYSPVNSS